MPLIASGVAEAIPAASAALAAFKAVVKKYSSVPLTGISRVEVVTALPFVGAAGLPSPEVACCPSAPAVEALALDTLWVETPASRLSALIWVRITGPARKLSAHRD